MTARDRLMLIGIVAVALLLGVWFTTVAPERERASKVTAEVQAARRKLASAESQAADARGAQAQYASAYASLVSLGQAVPSSPETPALIYMLDRATHSHDVQFTSITNGSPGSSAAAATAAPTAATAATFTQQPFTFVFNGGFIDLYKLLEKLEGFTVQSPSGTVRVDGRLLTIDGVNLNPETTEGQGSKSHASRSMPLTGTVTATAYVLPAGESALAGATPAGPAGASSGTTASTASTASASPSATTPAVVKVNP
jgi:hypothetical protein